MHWQQKHVRAGAIFQAQQNKLFNLFCGFYCLAIVIATLLLLDMLAGHVGIYKYEYCVRA